MDWFFLHFRKWDMNYFNPNLAGHKQTRRKVVSVMWGNGGDTKPGVVVGDS